ncbi:4Fe-4S binding protein [Sorangium sp. So ce233]
MIELLSDARCIDCNLCVKVCPTNVFEARPGEAPFIARQDDCQTCWHGPQPHVPVPRREGRAMNIA